MIFVNGDFYIGDWVKGKWHGQGRIEYNNGDYYEG